MSEEIIRKALKLIFWAIVIYAFIYWFASGAFYRWNDKHEERYIIRGGLKHLKMEDVER